MFNSGGGNNNAGIYFENVSNGYIIENYCFNNSYAGIFLNGQYNKIQGNEIYNNYHGIIIRNATKNIISDNCYILFQGLQIPLSRADIYSIQHR